METFKTYARILLNIVIPLLMVLLIIYLGPKLISFFMPFVIGFIISLIANPLVKFLEKRLKIVRKHGSVIIVVGVLALVIFGGYLLLSALITQLVRFVTDLPALIEGLTAEFQVILDNSADLFAKLPIKTDTDPYALVDSLSTSLLEWVKSIASPTITVTGNIVKQIPNFFVQAIITILSAYFFTSDRDDVYHAAGSLIPKKWIKHIQKLRANVKSLVGGYFAAQFKIMAVIAVILFVGFIVLGVNYSLVLALLIAFLDFLPVFGTGTVLLPWAIVKLLAGEYSMVVGLIAIYLISQLVRQMIQPKIVGDTMGIKPLPTLLFLYLGFRFYGLGGMILAVPVGILIMEIYQLGVFDSFITNVKALFREINHFRKPEEKD